MNPIYTGTLKKVTAIKPEATESNTVLDFNHYKTYLASCLSGDASSVVDAISSVFGPQVWAYRLLSDASPFHNTTIYNVPESIVKHVASAFRDAGYKTAIESQPLPSCTLHAGVISQHKGRDGEAYVAHLIGLVHPELSLMPASDHIHNTDIHALDGHSDTLYAIEVKYKEIVTARDVSKFKRDIEEISLRRDEMIIGVFISLSCPIIPGFGEYARDGNNVYLGKRYATPESLRILLDHTLYTRSSLPTRMRLMLSDYPGLPYGREFIEYVNSFRPEHIKMKELKERFPLSMDYLKLTRDGILKAFHYSAWRPKQ